MLGYTSVYDLVEICLNTFVYLGVQGFKAIVPLFATRKVVRKGIPCVHALMLLTTIWMLVVVQLISAVCITMDDCWCMNFMGTGAFADFLLDGLVFISLD